MSVLNEIQESLKNSAEGQENSASNSENNNQPDKNSGNQNSESGENNDSQPQNNQNNNDAGNTANNQSAADNQENTAASKQSVFANEELAEANAFMLKNPGKTFSDYQALKVPTASIGEEDLLRSYLSEKEGKTKSAIDYELKKLELKDSDGDFDDDFSDDEDSLEHLKKKAEREELIQKAREWRDGYVKEQLAFDGDNQFEQNADNNQPAAKSLDDFLLDAKRKQDEFKQNYQSEIYKAVGEINQIPLQINGKEVLFTPDDNFKTEMRIGAEDVSAIGKEFFDENGNISNASEFIKQNTLWANPKTRQAMLDFMVEQAVLEDRASRDKGQRNITLNDKQPHSVNGNDDDGGKVVDQMLARNRTSF